jgi:hypothetical protein
LELQLEKEFDYIPRWNGNQEDESPIIAHCRIMTEPERERLFEQYYANGDYRIVPHNREIVTTCVLGFTNFKINGKDVKDGRALIGFPKVAKLVDEIAQEIVVRTQRPDLKN